MRGTPPRARGGGRGEQLRGGGEGPRGGWEGRVLAWGRDLERWKEGGEPGRVDFGPNI